MNEATELTCANCGEPSTNPGQFVGDGRWVCCQACKSELADAQSYDDLAASGGIVENEHVLAHDPPSVSECVTTPIEKGPPQC